MVPALPASIVTVALYAPGTSSAAGLAERVSCKLVTPFTGSTTPLMAAPVTPSIASQLATDWPATV